MSYPVKTRIGLILAVAFAGVAYLPTKGLASLIMTSYASLPDARVSVGTLQTRSTEKAAQKRTLLEEIRNANANWLLRWERALNYSVSYHYERIHIDGDGEEEAVFSVPLKGLYDRGIDFLPEAEVLLYYENALPEVVRVSSPDGREVIVLRYVGHRPTCSAATELPITHWATTRENGHQDPPANALPLGNGRPCGWAVSASFRRGYVDARDFSRWT